MLAVEAFTLLFVAFSSYKSSGRTTSICIMEETESYCGWQDMRQDLRQNRRQDRRQDMRQNRRQDRRHETNQETG